MSTTSTTPDFAAIKAKQSATWASGDYSRIGSTLQLVGEELAEALDMPPGSRVLDVAAGNGNATLAMARRFCDVTSTDFAEPLLERGCLRAGAEGFDVDFRTADAEQLPFGDGEFDAVVSTFGVMFTPNQEQSARELARVCRGVIGLANWTPESFIGRLFGVIGKHVPPPAGLHSPARWGTEEWLRAQFGPHAQEIVICEKSFSFRYRSPQHFIDVFRTYYGPVEKAFQAVGDGAAQLEADILALVAELDVATDGTMCVPAGYLEVLVRKA